MLASISLFAVIFFVALTPGPDVLFVTRTSLSKGFTHAFMVILGIVTGLCCYVALVVLGLSNLSENMYFLLGISSFGACYLLFIAASSWNAYMQIQADFKQQRNLLKYYIQGLMMNLSNPKAMIFFTVILTPFLNQDKLYLQGFIIIAASFTAFMMVASILSKFRNILKPQHTLIINRISAIIFLAFAVQLFYNAYQQMMILI